MARHATSYEPCVATLRNHRQQMLVAVPKNASDLLCGGWLQEEPRLANILLRPVTVVILEFNLVCDYLARHWQDLLEELDVVFSHDREFGLSLRHRYKVRFYH